MEVKNIKLSREFDTNSKHAFHKLLKDQELVDVTLVCDGDKQIKAHKVILSAGSLFFAKLFRNNPHQHPLVYLSGIEWTDLEAIIEFLYLGEVNIEEINLKRFMSISERFKIVGMNTNSSAQQAKYSRTDMNQINKELPRKPKTPDLVKNCSDKLPDKEFVEETMKEINLFSEFENSQGRTEENMKLGEGESLKNIVVAPPIAAYGYHSVIKPKENSQKSSLRKLNESFDRYENQKATHIRTINLDKNRRHERLNQKSSCLEKFSCDQCRYQALSKDEFTMHRIAKHFSICL